MFKKYKQGFFTKLNTDNLGYGINKDIIIAISKKKNEPSWMLDFRIKAFNIWKDMSEPHWLNASYEKLDYQKYIYYSAPCINNNLNFDNIKNKKSSNDNGNNYLTKEVKRTFDKLNIPINKNNKLAIDAIFDSVSVATTCSDFLKKKGIIFCSLSYAINKYPFLVKKYLGMVVPLDDNFFAALNSAVVSDGTFVYVPRGVHCPMELSTYFRINSKNTGQFERTIIIAEENSYVSYIEGCSAPIHHKHQLHAAVVEVILHKNARVKYSTVQNWFPGDNINNGILNFVTKRALCLGVGSRMSWVQSETGSAITWKYPSVILKGDHSIGEFFSVALTTGYQQADTGTKMFHIGKNTKSTIISKSISTFKSRNTYRGIVKINKGASNSRNYTQCDSMLIGNNSKAYTFPSIKVKNNTSQVEHEATVSKINEDQLFYCLQRCINQDDAVSMIVNGFCKEIFTELPLEFAVEAKKLLSINLENSVG
ncbi:Fe-S cluster assembly protein SufB [Candidatus Purcelliella pentastirinorum]|uniref:Fe-S cluster assembly protein SufB n=1 Tax=Candidatus Purcelliella pentastirinorum TaxID=472834 RepID=UPI00237BEAEB|nr:Fe-S cluster assembly protein SufB [Candidatus Purcelliella pentastirinorum]WDR80360.1 Fe-S cluster assembly protein SufB [Candidatus Purcelliella pentastirinorum]